MKFDKIACDTYSVTDKGGNQIATIEPKNNFIWCYAPGREPQKMAREAADSKSNLVRLFEATL